MPFSDDEGAAEPADDEDPKSPKSPASPSSPSGKKSKSPKNRKSRSSKLERKANKEERIRGSIQVVEKKSLLAIQELTSARRERLVGSNQANDRILVFTGDLALEIDRPYGFDQNPIIDEDSGRLDIDAVQNPANELTSSGPEGPESSSDLISSSPGQRSALGQRRSEFGAQRTSELTAPSSFASPLGQRRASEMMSPVSPSSPTSARAQRRSVSSGIIGSLSPSSVASLEDRRNLTHEISKDIKDLQLPEHAQILLSGEQKVTSRLQKESHVALEQFTTLTKQLEGLLIGTPALESPTASSSKSLDEPFRVDIEKWPGSPVERFLRRVAIGSQTGSGLSRLDKEHLALGIILQELSQQSVAGRGFSTSRLLVLAHAALCSKAENSNLDCISTNESSQHKIITQPPLSTMIPNLDESQQQKAPPSLSSEVILGQGHSNGVPSRSSAVGNDLVQQQDSRIRLWERFFSYRELGRADKQRLLAPTPAGAWNQKAPAPPNQRDRSASHASSVFVPPTPRMSTSLYGDMTPMSQQSPNQRWAPIAEVVDENQCSNLSSPHSPESKYFGLKNGTRPLTDDGSGTPTSVTSNATNGKLGDLKAQNLEGPAFFKALDRKRQIARPRWPMIGVSSTRGKQSASLYSCDKGSSKSSAAVAAVPAVDKGLPHVFNEEQRGRLGADQQIRNLSGFDVGKLPGEIEEALPEAACQSDKVEVPHRAQTPLCLPEGVAFPLIKTWNRRRETENPDRQNEAWRCRYCRENDLWADTSALFSKGSPGGEICVSCGESKKREERRERDKRFEIMAQKKKEAEELEAERKREADLAKERQEQEMDSDEDLPLELQPELSTGGDAGLEILRHTRGRHPESWHYFAACERLQAGPLAEAAVFEPSDSAMTDPVILSVRDRGLKDDGLRAIIKSARRLKRSFFAAAGQGFELLLSGNNVTDDGLGELIDALQPLGWAKEVQVIDISRNRYVSARVLLPLTRLLGEDALPRLRALMVSGVDLPDAALVALCSGLSSGCPDLRELDLSFTGVGRMSQASCNAVAEVIVGCLLTSVDLSGNHLRREGFEGILVALCSASAVEKLCISHNAAAPPHADAQRLPKAGAGWDKEIPFPPIDLLCEGLQKLPTLKHVDLRSSQLDSRSAFVLAWALRSHINVENVLLGGNSLGITGLRAILQMILLSERAQLENDKLKAVDLDLCAEAAEAFLPSASDVNFVDPSGTYTLYLERPYDRAVALQCAQRGQAAAKGGRSADDIFFNVTLDGNPFNMGRVDSSSNSLQRGTLRFTMVIAQKNRKEAADPATLGTDSMEENQRTLTPKLEARLLESIATCKDDHSKQAVISAFAYDFKLSTSLLERLCDIASGSPFLRRQFYSMLLDKLIDPEKAVGLVSDFKSVHALSPSRGPETQLRSGLTCIEFFNGSNPTGHYVLDLARPVEHILAAHILRIAHWEVEHAKMLKRPDLSQWGNYQPIRNETLDHQAFRYAQDWALPDFGIFEFDFASLRRLQHNTKTIDEALWKQIVEAMKVSELPFVLRVQCFRKFSHLISVSCEQAKALYTALRSVKDASGVAFGASAQQMLFTIVFCRLRDHQEISTIFFNPDEQGGEVQETGGDDKKKKKKAKKKKVATGFFTAEDIRTFERRLGYLPCFNPNQLSTLKRYRLNHHDERMVLTILLNIAIRETGGFIHPDTFKGSSFGQVGGEDLYPGVPPDLWIKRGPPDCGLADVVYHSREPDGACRKEICRKPCGWD